MQCRLSSLGVCESDVSGLCNNTFIQEQYTRLFSLDSFFPGKKKKRLNLYLSCCEDFFVWFFPLSPNLHVDAAENLILPGVVAN